MKKREILVTSALPYANGPIHLGHMLEYIQTDLWVRFQRLCGHDCHYVCADDAHGSPIMLKARELELAPETMITTVKQEHLRDFNGFLISFDNYHSTHSEENREFSELIYSRLKKQGLIHTKTIVQAYDEQTQMFLPDRFIKGECPRCGAADQYGDCCEVCGATYNVSELKKSYSVLSGKPPVERESEHYFFALSQSEKELHNWLNEPGRVQPEIRNKLNEWFEVGLQDWDISRDAPYFGFEIPDHPKKYFYVWLDAPIGYIASFKHYCARTGIDFEHYWKPDSPTELHHFIGKDIAYFHTLFWPAMLKGANFRQPTSVNCHGFVTINKAKMSKSRGPFITAETYLASLPAEYLRYYFATRLTSRIEDIDLNLDDFVQRVNSDLVGKFVNIASRCAGFIKKSFANKILCDTETKQHKLLNAAEEMVANVAQAYENREFASAMREIMQLADKVNQYIDKHKPWDLLKDKDNPTASIKQAHIVCSVSLMVFAYLARALIPILPQTGEKIATFLKLEFDHWNQPLFQDDTHDINNFTPLIQRIDKTVVDKIASQSQLPQSNNEPTNSQHKKRIPMITYDDFKKLDLRVARIIKADTVENADKLLQLTLDDGEGSRTVLAGIKSSYSAETLVGRHVILVANLAPKKMRFGTSEGMVLAAGDDDIFLLSPDLGATAGMPVK